MLLSIVCNENAVLFETTHFMSHMRQIFFMDENQCNIIIIFTMLCVACCFSKYSIRTQFQNIAWTMFPIELVNYKTFVFMIRVTYERNTSVLVLTSQKDQSLTRHTVHIAHRVLINTRSSVQIVVSLKLFFNIFPRTTLKQLAFFNILTRTTLSKNYVKFIIISRF